MSNQNLAEALVKITEIARQEGALPLDWNAILCDIMGKPPGTRIIMDIHDKSRSLGRLGSG